MDEFAHALLRIESGAPVLFSLISMLGLFFLFGIFILQKAAKHERSHSALAIIGSGIEFVTLTGIVLYAMHTYGSPLVALLSGIMTVFVFSIMRLVWNGLPR